MHHRLVHEEGYRVHFPPWARPVFYDPRGLPLPDAPPRIRLDRGAAERLLRENRVRGVAPDSWTCTPRYRREADVRWDAMVRVLEALDPTDDAGSADED